MKLNKSSTTILMNAMLERHISSCLAYLEVSVLDSHNWPAEWVSACELVNLVR